MIIIEHGNTYHEYKCKRCGAIIGYSQGDTQTSYCDDPFGGDNWAYIVYIDCPECRRRNVLREVINGEETINEIRKHNSK